MSYPYNPHKHHRKTIRWQGYDYGEPAYYFITICTHQRQYLFEDERFFDIATFAWQNLPTYPKSQHVEIDESIVMPNHKHGIIAIRDRIETATISKETETITLHNVASGKLGRLVGTYKAMVTTRINKVRGTTGSKVWQQGYWDRVIRNERELNAIRHYIRENPARWAEDQDNLDNLLGKMNHHP
jgi:REP element-mobilizing transposase RayT